MWGGGEDAHKADVCGARGGRGPGGRLGARPGRRRRGAPGPGRGGREGLPASASESSGGRSRALQRSRARATVGVSNSCSGVEISASVSRPACLPRTEQNRL